MGKRWLVVANKKQGNQFVSPFCIHDKWNLMHLKSGKCIDRCRVVFIGVEIDCDEIWSKANEEIKLHANKEETFKIMSIWFDIIQTSRIGACFRIDESGLPIEDGRLD